MPPPHVDERCPPTPLIAFLCREPFRIFFPLGVLCGMLGVGHWLAYAAGWTEAYSGFFHAGIQMQAYMTCFVLGFLMTALPRMTSAPPATPADVGGLLGLLLMQLGGALSGQWLLAQAGFAGALVLALLFGARRVAQRGAGVLPPAEFIWIPIALLHGVIGSVLIAIGLRGHDAAWLLRAGRPMVQQGFLLAIVVGVGGFMAPRLLGHAVMPSAALAGVTPAATTRWRKRRISWHLAAGLALWSSFWLEGAGLQRWAYVARAAVVVGELVWLARLYRRPRVPALYAWLLWLALWFVILGQALAAAWLARRVEMLHVVFVGGFTLMTFAVGTMVVFSHAGEVHRLQEPLPLLWVTAVGVLVALMLRVLVIAWPAAYFPLLGAAALSWLIAAASWLALTVPLLWRIMPVGTFEREHDLRHSLLKAVQ